jgi:hypothetical protein
MIRKQRIKLAVACLEEKNEYLVLIGNLKDGHYYEGLGIDEGILLK